MTVKDAISIPEGKRTVWILRVTNQCPREMDFSSLLVYSAMVSRAKFDRPVSARQLSQATGVDYHRATLGAVKNLHNMGLALPQGKRWVAVKPPESWFGSRKGKKLVPAWHETMAFFPALVPQSGPGRLQSRASALYWLLVSLGNRKRLARCTQTGLATLLRVPPVTIRNSLGVLKTYGLVNTFKRPIAPESENLKLWADKPRKAPKPIPEPIAGPPDLSDVGRMMIREYKVPAGMAAKIQKIMEGAKWSPEACRDFLASVDEQSKKQILVGTQRVKHCGYLALHKLEDVDDVQPVVAKPAFDWESPDGKKELDDIAQKVLNRTSCDVQRAVRWANDADMDARAGIKDWRKAREVLKMLVEQTLSRMEGLRCQDINDFNDSYNKCCTEYVSQWRMTSGAKDKSVQSAPSTGGIPHAPDPDGPRNRDRPTATMEDRSTDGVLAV